ncbi:MAG: periplasmic heavy metal sensor [Verrucomicrobia bacterium]|nr:MAG: periplasmic heavy metal sensor [Verrucomicrobiota bacterium]
MNKNKQTWLAAAVVAALGLVGVARAADDQAVGAEPKKPQGCPTCQKHEGPGGGEMRHGPGPLGIREEIGRKVMGYVFEQLNLSDEQKAKVKEIMESHKAEGQAMMEKIGPERQALQKLIMADTLDEQAIRDQVAKLAGLEADAAVARAKIGQEIRAILTPEQAEKAKDLQAKREARMKAEHEHGPVGERPEKQ